MWVRGWEFNFLIFYCIPQCVNWGGNWVALEPWSNPTSVPARDKLIYWFKNDLKKIYVKLITAASRSPEKKNCNNNQQSALHWRTVWGAFWSSIHLIPVHLSSVSVLASASTAAAVGDFSAFFATSAAHSRHNSNCNALETKAPAQCSRKMGENPQSTTRRALKTQPTQLKMRTRFRYRHNRSVTFCQSFGRSFNWGSCKEIARVELKSGDKLLLHQGKYCTKSVF